MRKLKAVLLIVLASLIVSFAAVTVASGASGITVLENDSFTSSLGSSSAQNNVNFDAGYTGPAKQSKLTRQEGADGGAYAVFSPTLTGSPTRQRRRCFSRQASARRLR